MKTEHKGSWACVKFSLAGCTSRLLHSRKPQPSLLFCNEIHFPFTFLILEKVSAVNKYNPPPELVAAQDHMTHVGNSLMQPQRILDRYSFGVASPGRPSSFSPALCSVTPSSLTSSERGAKSSSHRLCCLRYRVDHPRVEYGLSRCFPKCGGEWIHCPSFFWPLCGG